MSLFYKLESLLCCTQFLNETVCPLGSEYPCCGLWALDWKKLTVMAFVLLAWHLFPHRSGREDGTAQSGPLIQLAALPPAGCSRWPGQSCQAVLSMTLLGQSPLHLIEGRARLMPPTMSKSFVPPWPALPFPTRSQPLFLLAPPLGDKWQQGSGSQYLQAA